MPPPDFSRVRANSLISYPESPEFGPDDGGLLIAAPAQGPRADGVYPLCGNLMLQHSRLVGFGEPFPDPRFDLRLVASAPALGQVRSGALVGSENRERRAFPPLSPQESTETWVSLYFNPDLMSCLELPESAATWYVYAYFAGIVSNPLTIVIAPQG